MRKRFLAVLLCFCMVVVLVPATALAAPTGTAGIQLGASAIDEGETVYFGQYTSSGTTYDVPWYVLNGEKGSDGTTGNAFFLSKYSLGTSDFQSSGSGYYSGSTLQATMSGIYDGFAENEQNAITATNLADVSVNNARLFPLSHDQAKACNQSYIEAKDIAKLDGGSKSWWTRTSVDSTNVITMDYGNSTHTEVSLVDGGEYTYVRPALNLNLGSVLFASSAIGGKASGTVGTNGLRSVSDNSSGAWKLTLSDNSRSSFTASINGSDTVEAGGSVSIDYSGAQTGTNEYVSAIITNSLDQTLYYGNIANNSASGTAQEIAIPSDLAAGSYTLKIFNEQLNGDKKTDYASGFKDIAITVKGAVDTTAPELTAGTVNRTSDTSATVKFTSSEAGQYFYEIVSKGDPAPTISTTETGTDCSTTEQTITPTLTAGAKDVYIVVKDAAGNVSDRTFKIMIPAYVTPGLTAGAIKRTSNTAATVKFTSDTEGEYYYAIVPKNSAAPIIDTSKSGTSCDTTEQTITTTLTAGAKDVYIVVKDAAGNVTSTPLKITIPAFEATLKEMPVMQYVNSGNPTGGISGYDSINAVYHYVYYGINDSAPLKWRVLDDQTNKGETGLFLLSENLLGTGASGNIFFDSTEPYSYEWQGSDAQGWCRDFAGEPGASTTVADAFTGNELAAILATTKDDGAFISSTHEVNFVEATGILNGDKVFLLSAEEAENRAYGFTDDSSRIANYAGAAWGGWLRSSMTEEDYVAAGVVDLDGSLTGSPGEYSFAARPAFNLNLNTVLFTSAAVGGKSSGTVGEDALTAISINGINQWKLTLLDADRNFTAATTAVMGNTLTISYSGAEVDTNEYISAIVKDDNGNITHYGRLKNTTEAADASGTVTIDLSDVDMAGKTLHIFNEQYNGDKMTDYASTPVEVSRTIMPSALDNSISGITAGQVYALGDTVTFTATGAGMSNTSPNEGDMRWLPTAWETNPAGNFNSGYTQSFSTKGMTLGEHTLTVTFTQQQYNGSEWVNVSPAIPYALQPDNESASTDVSSTVTDTKSVNFTVTAISDPTITTDPTITAGTTTTAPATSDNSMLGLWLVVAVLASAGFAGSIVVMRKKRHCKR